MTAFVDQGLGVWGCADDPQAQVRLRDRALDKLRQGLCVFDGQRRLLLFNRRYVYRRAMMNGSTRNQGWFSTHVS